ncbi:MAG: OmpA family protein [Bacteroidota bacterium]
MLSENRANAVRDYLLNKGIAADCLAARGYGESEPVADNKTSEGRAKNRRVEIRVK